MGIYSNIPDEQLKLATVFVTGAPYDRAAIYPAIRALCEDSVKDAEILITLIEEIIEGLDTSVLDRLQWRAVFAGEADLPGCIISPYDPGSVDRFDNAGWITVRLALRSEQYRPDIFGRGPSRHHTALFSSTKPTEEPPTQFRAVGPTPTAMDRVLEPRLMPYGEAINRLAIITSALFVAKIHDDILAIITHHGLHDTSHYSVLFSVSLGTFHINLITNEGVGLADQRTGFNFSFGCKLNPDGSVMLENQMATRQLPYQEIISLLHGLTQRLSSGIQIHWTHQLGYGTYPPFQRQQSGFQYGGPPPMQAYWSQHPSARFSVPRLGLHETDLSWSQRSGNRPHLVSVRTEADEYKDIQHYIQMLVSVYPSGEFFLGVFEKLMHKGSGTIEDPFINHQFVFTISPAPFGSLVILESIEPVTGRMIFTHTVALHTA